MIRCPHCLHDDSTVYETKTDRGDFLLRYRICKKCNKKFPTHELPAIFVSKKRCYLLDVTPIMGEELHG